MARRLLVTYLTITALALASVIVPLGLTFADHERDQLSFGIERDAQAIASMAEDALEGGTTPSVNSVLSDYRASGGRVVIVDRRGFSVADSDNVGGGPRDFSSRPEMAAALDGQRATGTRRSETLGTNLVYAAVPVASGGVVHGAVRITYPTSKVDARVRDAWVRLALLSAVVLGIVAGVGVVFARGVTRPVRRLERAAHDLAAGDLTVRVDTNDGPPELRALGETFNTTAQQLGQLVESQHRFVADASHQLRTPLTALRLRLETLEPYVADSAQPKLHAAVSETNRLARLVQSLLVLARTDATTSTCEPVELSAIVSGRVDAWSPVAGDQAVQLVADVPGDVWVDAVRGAVEQMLDNLISNALDIAPEGTAVTIRIIPRAEGTEVHVIDQGPGMPPEERARAFERFWRAGSSTGGGFGLGLAIVARLAEQCGGEARLDHGPDGRGLDAVVSLRPLPAPNRDERRKAKKRDATLYPTLTIG